jgi:hypothetical protein
MSKAAVAFINNNWRRFRRPRALYRGSHVRAANLDICHANTSETIIISNVLVRMGNPGVLVADRSPADSNGSDRFHIPEGNVGDCNSLGYWVHSDIDIFVANQAGHP